MEDENLKIEISSESLKNVVFVIIELVGRVYSEKLSELPQGSTGLNPEGNFITI
jgi:hypothetical protein